MAGRAKQLEADAAAMCAKSDSNSSVGCSLNERSLLSGSNNGNNTSISPRPKRPSTPFKAADRKEYKANASLG
eukprot:scaffold136356_cov30-Prasinocladus_malaysianus.AAC.1